jgi:hypothetical protein
MVEFGATWQKGSFQTYLPFLYLYGKLSATAGVCVDTPAELSI